MGQIFPMAYCLLANKMAPSYQVIFDILVSKMEGAPWIQKFRCDLEKTLALEFMKKFPNAHVETCMFHFAQANWRKIQS